MTSPNLTEKISLLLQQFTFHPGSFPNNPQDTGYVHIDKLTTTCSRIGYRKFFLDSSLVSVSQFWGGSSNIVYYYFGNPKIYLFRYAQTVLTFAEAEARSGQLNAKAYESVNEIRRRAHHLNLYSPSPYDLQPGLSAQAFADSVVQERAWELAGEPEGRWFDLVRLEEVEDLPNLRDPEEGGPPSFPSKKDYFFPIPEEDINLNPNLGQ